MITLISLILVIWDDILVLYDTVTIWSFSCTYVYIVHSSHFQSFSSFNGHGHGLFWSFGLFDRKVSPGEWSCWWSESLVQELGEFPVRKQILGSLYLDEKLLLLISINFTPKTSPVAWRNGNTLTLCFLGSLNLPIFFTKYLHFFSP